MNPLQSPDRAGTPPDTRLFRFSSERSWYEAFRDAIIDAITASRYYRENLSLKNRFNLCLSGGVTPLPLYRLLSTDIRIARITDGMRLVFWIGDERAVPVTDPESNGAAILDAFSGCMWPSRPRIMLWPEATPETRGKACETYARLLTDALGNTPVFDLVFLGLGNDGHYAGIFPGDAASPPGADTGKIAYPTSAPGTPVYRMTLGQKVLLSSSRRLILVRGSGKAGIVERLMDGDESLPASRASRGANILYLEKD